MIADGAGHKVIIALLGLGFDHHVAHAHDAETVLAVERDEELLVGVAMAAALHRLLEMVHYILSIIWNR